MLPGRPEFAVFFSARIEDCNRQLSTHERSARAVLVPNPSQGARRPRGVANHARGAEISSRRLLRSLQARTSAADSRAMHCPAPATIPLPRRCLVMNRFAISHQADHAVDAGMASNITQDRITTAWRLAYLGEFDAGEDTGGARERGRTGRTASSPIRGPESGSFNGFTCAANEARSALARLLRAPGHAGTVRLRQATPRAGLARAPRGPGRRRGRDRARARRTARQAREAEVRQVQAVLRARRETGNPALATPQHERPHDPRPCPPRCCGTRRRPVHVHWNKWHTLRIAHEA